MPTKANIRHIYGGPEVLEWKDVDGREPLEGEVQLQVRAASVNAADLHLLRGTPLIARVVFGLFRPKAQRIGADVAGTVLKVGPGVERLKVGDRVFGDLSSHGFGAFGEEAVVSEAPLVRVPDDLPLEQAAAVPMGAVTALQAIRTKGDVTDGDEVLVTGASGGVGSFAVQIARALGGRVTAVTSTPHLQAVKALGAARVIDRTEQDVRALPERYDLIIEAGGFGSVPQMIKLLKPGGRYVFVGGSFSATGAAAIRGRSMLAMSNPEDLATVARWLEDGDVRPLVGATFPMSQAAAALQRFEEGGVGGKIVLVNEAG